MPSLIEAYYSPESGTYLILRDTAEEMRLKLSPYPKYEPLREKGFSSGSRQGIPLANIPVADRASGSYGVCKGGSQNPQGFLLPQAPISDDPPIGKMRHTTPIPGISQSEDRKKM